MIRRVTAIWLIAAVAAVGSLPRDTVGFLRNGNGNLANDWVRSQITQARRLDAWDDHKDALAHLGFALHTVQDSASPACGGLQFWK